MAGLITLGFRRSVSNRSFVIQSLYGVGYFTFIAAVYDNLWPVFVSSYIFYELDKTNKKLGRDFGHLEGMKIGPFIQNHARYTRTLSIS